MIYIMVVFSIIGGLDKIFNTRFGLGGKFDEGIKDIGGLALTIIGIYCLSPIIAMLLSPVLNPFAKLLGDRKSVV